MSSAASNQITWIEYEKAHPIIVPDTLSDPLPMSMDAAVQFERARESRGATSEDGGRDAEKNQEKK